MKSYNNSTPLQVSDKGKDMDKHIALEPEMVAHELREIKESVAKIADAMVQLAVLNERQTHTADRLNRLEAAHDETVRQVSVTREDQLKLLATIDGVSKTMRVFWAVVGGGVLLVGGKLILMALQ